jgi:hypothetical protein
MASTAPTSPLWQAILARLDPAPEKLTIDSVHEAIGKKVVGRGTVQRIKEGVGIQLNAMTAIAERLGCDVTELIRAAEGEPVKVAPRPRERRSVGEVVLSLAQALQQLDERRRDGVADAVARMLKMGPDQTEANVLDTWVGGLSVSLTVNSSALDETVCSDDSPAAPLVVGIPQPQRAASIQEGNACQEETTTRTAPFSPLVPEQQTHGGKASRKRKA